MMNAAKIYTLYEEYEIWTDNNDNKFCSDICTKEFHGIKEIE